jgi:chemotaxis signal transduction protein
MSINQQHVSTELAWLVPKPQAEARLVEYAPGRKIALPPHTTYGLIESPSHVIVPGAARYAHGLLAWQGKWLPLLDLHTLLQTDTCVEQTVAPRYALVLAFQRAARQPVEYGAIALTTLPQTITVGDEAQCDLPTDSMRWSMLALSCFRHEDQAIPILDTAQIFSAYHGETPIDLCL